MPKTNFEHGTIVTPDFLNTIYKSGSGHIHDGADADGHAGKISLENHTSGKINLNTQTSGKIDLESQVSGKIDLATQVKGTIQFESMPAAIPLSGIALTPAIDSYATYHNNGMTPLPSITFRFHASPVSRTVISTDLTVEDWLVAAHFSKATLIIFNGSHQSSTINIPFTFEGNAAQLQKFFPDSEIRVPVFIPNAATASLSVESNSLKFTLLNITMPEGDASLSLFAGCAIYMVRRVVTVEPETPEKPSTP
jgi:hypothetical protein